MFVAKESRYTKPKQNGQDNRADHQPDHGHEQHPIDERDVDLPDLAVGRVQDLEARQEAQLDRLLRDGERARNHSLRRDDRGGDRSGLPLFYISR